MERCYDEKIVVFGSDERQAYLAQIFEDMNYEVVMCNVTGMPWDVKDLRINNNIEQVVEFGEIFIAPMRYLDGTKVEILPLNSRQILFGGNILETMKNYCRENGVEYHDFADSEEIMTKNAEPTALGATIEAISMGGGILQDKKCLVAGFGRCGRVLAHKLLNLHHADVTVMVRRPEIMAEIEKCGYHAASMDCPLDKYTYIFNTIPAPVLTKDRLTGVNNNVIIIDIASKPGGTDFDYCIEHSINAKLCLGIPGKQFPKTAAIILYEYIEKIISSRRQE